MTIPHEDLWARRCRTQQTLPAMGLCQRNPWDTMSSAEQASPPATESADNLLSLELTVSGADFPFGRFALPDETPIFLPHNYEPNYAYPLVVWLHDSEWTARELLDLMPRISPQNYLGLAVEGLTTTNRFAVGPLAPANAHDSIDALLEVLKDVACQMRREFHVHSERVYLAGFGDQAALALEMLLRRPEWFAGVLSFGLRKTHLAPISDFNELRGKRVFLGAGIRDTRVSLPEQVALGRLLRTTGMNVVLRSYDTADEPTPKWLRDVDQWLMNAVYDSTLVG